MESHNESTNHLTNHGLSRDVTVKMLYPYSIVMDNDGAFYKNKILILRDSLRWNTDTLLQVKTWSKVSFLFPWRISQTPWKLIRVQINRQNRYFSMWVPYYSMVKLAREANASWKFRKTVIVDLDKLDAKIEQQILWRDSCFQAVMQKSRL